MFGASKEDRWWSTYNAALTGFITSVERSLVKQDDGSFRSEVYFDAGQLHLDCANIADQAHGRLPE